MHNAWTERDLNCARDCLELLAENLDLDGAPSAAHHLVERWFAELTNKKIKRGSHKSVRALETDIRGWIDTWNEDPKPYVWTKTADEILEKLAAYCNQINKRTN